MAAKTTNVIEWKNPGPDDIVFVYPQEDMRLGVQLIVNEYETAIFLRDGKLFDVFPPGRHVLSTLNLPLLTRAFRFFAGYGETPFKAKVIFVSLKQLRGKFGLNMRIKLSQNSTWMTELQSFGDYYFRIEDPGLFLTEIVGGVPLISAETVTVFIREFLIQQAMQNFSEYDGMTIYNGLNKVTPKIRASLNEEFRNRGVQLLNVQFGSVNFPLLEKMEKEDPTYGLPLMVAIQSGDNAKVLDLIKVVESMRGLGKSPGAGLAAGVVAMPYLFGQQANYQQPLQQSPPPQQQPPAPAQQPTVAKQPDILSKLRELKDALDGGLITQEEYDSLKKDILSNWKKD